MTTESEIIRERIEEGSPGGPAIQVDNQPLAAAMEPKNEFEAKTQELMRLKQERARLLTVRQKEQELRELKELRAQRAETQWASENILTDPVPTGNPIIDDRYTTRPRKDKGAAREQNFGFFAGGASRPGEQRLAEPREFAPDSNEAVQASGARQGIDYRRGVGFGHQVSRALQMNTGKAQANTLTRILSDYSETLPEGAPMFRVGPDGKMMYLHQITEADVAAKREQPGSEGKYRWTSTESSGWQWDDFGKLFDLPEIGSLIGGVYGSIKGGHLTFFKNRIKGGQSGLIPGIKGTGVETGFGMLGRDIGHSIEILGAIMRGEDMSGVDFNMLITTPFLTEAMFALAGRGATRAVQTGMNIARRAPTLAQGIGHFDGSGRVLAELDDTFKRTAKDNELLNKRLEELSPDGPEVITTTRAEAETQFVADGGESATVPRKSVSGQQRRLDEEASRKLNAGEHERIAERDRQQADMAAKRMLAQDLGPQEALQEVSNRELNQAIKRMETLELRAHPRDAGHGWIVPQGLADRGPVEAGLSFKVGTDAMVVQSARLPQTARQTGLGKEMYVSYIKLAEKEGKEALSDSIVSEDAARVWRSLMDEGEFDIVMDPRAIAVDSTEHVMENGVAKERPIRQWFIPKDATVDPKSIAIMRDNVVDAPIFRVRKKAPEFTRAVLDDINKATRSSTGQFKKGQQWERVMYDAEDYELAAIKQETSKNFSRKVELAQHVYDEFLDKVVKKVEVTGKGATKKALQKQEELIQGLMDQGRPKEIIDREIGRLETMQLDAMKAGDAKIEEHFSVAARDEWLQDAAPMLEHLFTPEELLRVRSTDNIGAFRELISGLSERKTTLNTGLGTILKTSENSRLFRDTDQLFTAINNLPGRDRVRAFRMIETADPLMWEAVQNRMKAEISRAAYQPVKGQRVTAAGAEKFGTWLSKNEQGIRQMFGDEYMEHLLALNRSIGRTASAEGAKGVRRVTNPPGLMMARTVMGVMNKWQRRITAGRRVQMQKWYGRTMDIVTDPERMAKLAALDDIQRRAPDAVIMAADGLVRLGLADTREEAEQLQDFVRRWAPIIEQAGAE